MKIKKLNHACCEEVPVVQELPVEVLSLDLDDAPVIVNDEPCCLRTDDDFSMDDIVPNDVSDVAVRDTQSIIHNLIQDVQASIDRYNGVLSTIETPNNDLSYLVEIGVDAVIKNIISDENKHLGQLQRVIEKLVPESVSDVNMGKQATDAEMDVESEGDVLHPFFSNTHASELSNQMKMVDGIKKLPVQSFNYVDSKMNTESNTSNECDGTDLCTVSNIDDDF